MKALGLVIGALVAIGCGAPSESTCGVTDDGSCATGSSSSETSVGMTTFSTSASSSTASSTTQGTSASTSASTDTTSTTDPTLDSSEASTDPTRGTSSEASSSDPSVTTSSGTTSGTQEDSSGAIESSGASESSSGGGVPVCGDGLAEGSEACDGDDLDDTECADLDDFGGGDLGCSPDCTFDTSECCLGFGAECDGGCCDFLACVGGYCV